MDDMLLGISSHLCMMSCHSLKLARVREFIPQKLAVAANHGFFGFFKSQLLNIYQNNMSSDGPTSKTSLFPHSIAIPHPPPGPLWLPPHRLCAPFLSTVCPPLSSQRAPRKSEPVLALLTTLPWLPPPSESKPKPS